MKMQKNQFTYWKPVDYVLETEYGKITFKEWCERDAKRIGDCIVKEKQEKGRTFAAIFKKRGKK